MKDSTAESGQQGNSQDQRQTSTSQDSQSRTGKAPDWDRRRI